MKNLYIKKSLGNLSSHQSNLTYNKNMKINNQNEYTYNTNYNHLKNNYSSYTRRNSSLNRPLVNKAIGSSIISKKFHYNLNNNRLFNNLSLSNKLFPTNQIRNIKNYNNDKLNNNQNNNQNNNNNNKNNNYNNNTLNKRINHTFFERVHKNEIKKNKVLSPTQENKYLINSNNFIKIQNIKQSKLLTNNLRNSHNNNYKRINLSNNFSPKINKSNIKIIGRKNLSRSNNIENDKSNDNEINQNNHHIKDNHNKYSNIKFKLKSINSEIMTNNTINKTFSKNSINKNTIKSITKEENLYDAVNKEIGISNLGNTCFINSCLQILIHCPLFIKKLLRNLKLINENTPITSNFISICNMMMKTKEDSIDISDFKNLLGIKHKIFEGYFQNDSQEFFRILLEDISRELNEIKIEVLYRLLSNSDNKSKKIRDEDFHKNFSQREKSIITETFYAQIVNIFICECKAEIYSFQKILDFPLLFPGDINNNNITLYELLKYHFENELINFETKCEKCHKKSTHKKELKISRPPEILILSLQRIDEITQKKLRYKVEFPQILDIFEFIDHDCGFDRECKYHLFGIINHIGSIDSGHYYSDIKIENKDWIEFNDSKVSNIEKISDNSEYVYALFYIKQKYINPRVLRI